MYQKTVPGVWQGRVDDPNDSATFRWHQVVSCHHLFEDNLPPLTAGEKGIALLGFCCDEGVRRNQGRVGARKGPAALRKTLSSLACHFSKGVYLVDAGDVACEDTNLEAAQLTLRDAVHAILSQGYFPVVMGGGHEIAKGHFLGIFQHLKSAQPSPRIGIVNFDAHFDLRAPVSGSTSGTPFWEIAEHCREAGIEFHYLCLGIQPQSNTAKLFETASSLGVTFVEGNQMRWAHLTAIQERVATFLDSVEYVYVTIDLDGFAAHVAPGVSAPTALGYSTDLVNSLLGQLLRSGKVVSCDIAELNPNYDRDQQTARLAASLVYGMATVALQY